MYPLKMVIFHGYVSLPEGIPETGDQLMNTCQYHFFWLVVSNI
jgi:hypothetical protein